MALPPDQEGTAAEDAPPDDGDELEIIAIEDDDFIIRKVPDDHIHPKPDGRRRISKSAFSPSSPAVDPEQGMSTNVETMLVKAGVDHATFAPEFPALAKLSVGDVRKLGLRVEHRPLKGDPSHCNVLDVQDKHRKKLLGLADFIRKPADVD